ncbi:AAA family ATPase [Streptomyces sp. MUM 136J]|nr:AAA family ATPase [Streptomyces sp. MUM 2J]MCH0571873.1 AAA family ATPase [Streptomyces sp. MUM 136J]
MEFGDICLFWWWAMVGPMGGRSGFAFVGRGDQLRALVRALAVGPAVVLVEGEAGAGKSRLVEEARAQVEGSGVPVLQGWCHPLREPLPFGPVIDALRDGRSWLAPEAHVGPEAAALLPYLPEIADRLTPPRPDGPGWSDDVRSADHGGLDPASVRRGVVEVLERAGDVVLVVEDVHWVDEATRELLLLLARTPPPGLRLVLTYRGQELPGEGNVLGVAYQRPVGVNGAEIVLPPLDEAQVRELATSVIGSAAAGVLGGQLFERSGGLPLAAEEDLLVLAGRLERATADARDDGAGTALALLRESGVPRALREAVGSRVAELGSAGVAVVQAAAVLEVPAAEELLAVLAGLGEEEAEAGLTAALEASVLRESSPARYGFRHALACRAAYETIMAPRRRRLHRRAVETLQKQEPAPLVQIAHHTRLLGDAEAWIPRALAAADQAEAVGDDGVAADLLRQLLDEPALPPEERTRAALTLSHIALSRIEYAASVAAVRRIITDPALPAPTRGEIRLNLAWITSNQGEEGGALEVERAAGELGSRPDLAATAMASLGLGVLAFGTPVAQDLAWMDRAVSTVAGSEDEVARTNVLGSRISLLEHIGDPLARDLIMQLPYDSSDQEVLRQCAVGLHNAADGSFWLGHDRRAGVLLDQAEELARATGHQYLEASCASIRLQLDFADGRWAGLDERIAALAPEATERSTLQVEPLMARSLMDVARGQWPRAREGLTAIVGHTSRRGPIQWLLTATAALGRIGLAGGDPQAAWDRVQPALVVLRRKGVWVWTTDLVPTSVQAALGCGLREEAERLTDQAERGIEGRDAPGAAAEVLWCRALLAADTDPGRAVDLLERASGQFRAIGRVHRAARITEQAGRLLMDTSPSRAARHLQQALDAYTSLGATSDQSHCEQVLRDAGGQRSAHRDRHSYGQQLSPRERQVAQLLASGATNRDIATALALSVRTAEHHVARILKKLHTTRNRVKDAL